MKTQIHQQALHGKYISQKLNCLPTTVSAAVGGLTGFQEHFNGVQIREHFTECVS